MNRSFPDCRAHADADADIVSRTLGARVDEYDLFDRLQLQRVLEVCETSASLSEAGRTLFAVSRQSRKQPNDADRLRKYLARFGVAWGDWLNPDEA
jgi:transcriptional regulatory protein RtcR